MDQMHSCEVHTDALGFLVVYDHVVDEKPHTQAKVYEWLDLPHFLCRQTNKADIDAALSGVGDDTHNATFDAMVAIEERKVSRAKPILVLVSGTLLNIGGTAALRWVSGILQFITGSSRESSFYPMAGECLDHGWVVSLYVPSRSKSALFGSSRRFCA